MNFDQKKRQVSWRRLIPLALAVSLVACGDGNGPSSSGSSSKSKPEKGPTTGKLLDAAVSGVAYAASSGASGTTNENGIFNYSHGDTVEFKLGSLVLGKVDGAPIVTPMELAGDSGNRLQNLLILLQSLDVDGKPENGISIPADAAAAVSASMNLESDPDAFTSSLELQKAREAGGVAGPIKTPEEANDHFLSQGINLLSTNIWVKYDDTSASVIRSSTAGGGEYLQGEATPEDSCDADRVCGGNLVSKAGVEYGAASVAEFDTRGFKFVGAPVIDTNLKAGLSHPRPTWRIRTDGSELIASDILTVQRERKQASLFGELFHIAGTLEISSDTEPVQTEVKETRFSKLQNNPQGILGAWAVDNTSIKTQTYVFFPNGKFMMIDPIGDLERPGHASCGGPGIEFASYTYDSGSKSLNVKSFTYDTNGCAGFSHNDAVSFDISADGNTAAVSTQDKSPLIVHRVSK
ncbi:MAG: adhesin [Nitrosospira sp.]|nr:adhesin [Nitrosospira sp.]